MSVREIDRGWKRLMADLKKVNKSYVKVGFPESKNEKHQDSELSIADIALIHETGAPEKNIPARPFMSMTFDATLPEIKKQVDTILDQVIAGKTTTQRGLGQLGAWYKGKIQEGFVKFQFKPNSPSTIAKVAAKAAAGKKRLQKAGASKFLKTALTKRPLIDTGQLRQSVDFEVVE